MALNQLFVLLVLGTCLSLSLALDVLPIECSSTPLSNTKPKLSPNEVDFTKLYGTWKVVKQSDANEDVNCVNIILNANSSNVSWTNFDLTTQKLNAGVVSINLAGLMSFQVTVIDTKEIYYLHQVDLEELTVVVYKCNGETPVIYASSKDTVKDIDVSTLDKMKDIKHDVCSGAATFMYQTLTVMMLFIGSLKLLL